ncbi:hypothetical protein [Anaerobacillus alkalidiazotrophicus]|nr:hypothetical protein [Anaerobacillus alkalidiazotrophicus]
MLPLNELSEVLDELENKELLSCSWNACPINHGNCFVVTCSFDIS